MITIAELRARNGKMSQQQLADALGTTQSNVSRWERDILSISSSQLVKLCRFFNVSADEILGVREAPKKFYPLHDFKSHNNEVS